MIVQVTYIGSSAGAIIASSDIMLARDFDSNFVGMVDFTALNYKDRGFETVKQHDDALVENWNRLVEADDVVYILGDVMMKYNLQDGDFSYGLSILEKLNGRLIIIRGNHDSEGKIERYKSCHNVVSAGDAALYLNYPAEGSYHFYLTHYPTLVSHKKLKPVKTALLNLYGHTHQTEHFYEDHPYMLRELDDAIINMPDRSILLETDSPYIRFHIEIKEW